MPVSRFAPAFDFERLYTLRNGKGSAVVSFVEKHPFLAPLLSEAHPHIQNHFPAAEVFLQHVEDPEIDDYEQLVVSIGTDLTAAEAVRRLQQWARDWWLDAMDRGQGKLCFTLEFR